MVDAYALTLAAFLLTAVSASITRTAFTTGLNLILLVAAIIALVSGAVSLAAIRSRDFAQQQGPVSPSAG